MGISVRLKTIADRVTPGYIAADIGTDHGFVPIYLVQNNICDKVIASDKSPGSLAKAEENVGRAGLDQQIECRLSDGFDAYSEGEIESAVISGMGGILMVRILSQSPEVVKALKELILSPHRDADLVREYVSSIGFKIVSDEILEDKGKKYCILKCVNHADISR